MKSNDWQIAGSDGEPILGSAHQPQTAKPRGVIIIAHGFKGYMDYGMFPWLAGRCAGDGFIAHCFNFSHSGMTRNIDTFERPDLFERDTWNRQTADVRAVLRAIHDGSIAGGGLPIVLFGHSRGGATVLLASGRHAGDEVLQPLRGICTAAAPSGTCFLSEEQCAQLLRDGSLISPSSRTGQELRIGVDWLREQRDDPEGHDLLKLIARIDLPILIIHGENDPTVPVEHAEHLANAARNARRLVIADADHVFNTPNPFPFDAEPGEHLRTVGDALVEFAASCCGDGV